MASKETSSKHSYFFHYVKLYRRDFFSGLFFLVITDGLDVVPPLIIMRGVDQIMKHAGVRALATTALIFAVLTMFLAGVRFLWRIQFGKFHQNLAMDLRRRVFNKLTALGPAFFTRNQTGELMSLITNDVESIRMGMGPGVLVITDAILYFLTIPPIMMWLSIPLTLESLAILPLLPFFVRWLTGIIHRRFLEVQDKFSDMAATSQEAIAGIRVIKGYAQEENQIAAFNKISRQWYNSSLKVAWAESFLHPVMEFCISAGMVVLLYFGSHSVIAGTLTIGGFVAFQRYISKMVWPMTAIGWGSSLIAQGRASLDRVHEFLETPEDVPDNEAEASHKSVTRGPLEVKNLSFQYPGAVDYALKNISFSVRPGEIIGIAGPVGSGKSTLVQLLTRLYEVEAGHIFLAGEDICQMPLGQLRRSITLVPQESFLFSTSIRENLKMGIIDDSASQDAVMDAAIVARIHDEIASMPLKYESTLGERGVNLSGGQKQRLTIARGLIRQSPILIFDDSLSAVDAETEKRIMEKIKPRTGQIIILISHRLASLASCDRVIVFNNGTIEAVGKPDELLITSQTYQELARRRPESGPP